MGLVYGGAYDHWSGRFESLALRANSVFQLLRASGLWTL